MNHPNLKRETRYGVPTADQILYNRHYTVGYSYHFRQAKWTLEIVDPDKTDVVRGDHFRSDYRIPEQFRAKEKVYINSGFHKGHLVASDNQIETPIQNSETFLLSNISPQAPSFNLGIWKKLEEAIRNLDKRENIFETYLITGPIFYFDQEVLMLGDDIPDIKVTLPIPHAFFKSILTESHTGRIEMWSFIIPNEKSDDNLTDYLVETTKVEKYSGLLLWETLLGTEIMKKKEKIKDMWEIA